MVEVIYKASPTIKHFHKSDKFVRGLMGPIGSGKSVACCCEIIRRSHMQLPNAEGIRKSRWAVIRNTYRELVDTTMETFFDWVPRDWGFWRAQDVKWTYQELLPDGTKVHLEVIFRALDRPNDIKKLLSLELTGGWLNEAREIPKAVLDMLVGRVGRYPSMRDGYGASWFGVIMDTNPPDSDHWWYRLFEEDCPDNYALFKQPSGLSEEAENVKNLPGTYYSNMMSGKDQEWINVYVHGDYGFIMDGKPIYGEYKDHAHFREEPYIPTNKLPIYIGLDFGLTPAAVFGQKTATGKWIIFDEIVTENMGTVNFAKLLKSRILHKYKDFEIEIYGDPAGDVRAQTDERTPFEILDQAGIVAWPTYTNDFLVRREAVAAPLGRLDAGGNSGFSLTPNCPMLRKGMAGGYKYKRLLVSGSERYQDKPDKNMYSHVCEALQYLMVGAGEGAGVVGGYNNKSIDYSETNKLVV